MASMATELKMKHVLVLLSPCDPPIASELRVSGPAETPAREVRFVAVPGRH
jgi:hypothetical protein